MDQENNTGRENIDFEMFDKKRINPDQEEEYIPQSLDSSREAMEIGKDLLEEARVYWLALDDFRARRKRSRDYYNGKQWGDLITDPDDSSHSKITEENYLIRTGKQPTVNNQIQQIMKNMLGQFRDNDYKPMARARAREHASASEMMSNAIQYVYDSNELKELDARTCEEFLMSGVICWKSGYEWSRERNLDEVVTDTPSVPRLFWNTDIRDIRGKDLRLIGEMHDVHFAELIGTFAKTPEEEEQLRKIYSTAKDKVDSTTQSGSSREDGLDFYATYEDHLVRFFEVWKLKKKEKVFYHDTLHGTQGQHVLEVEEAIEEIEQENLMRYEEFLITVFQTTLEEATEEMLKVVYDSVLVIEYEVKKEDVWCYYYLAPHGEILKSGETPFQHESHPYTFRAFPLRDGEIFGFIEGIIDQQRNINRYFVMMDFMLTASAKGVLMVPEECLGKYTADEFADQWVRHNGVIVYTPSKTGAKPEQVFANSSSPAAQQLLSLQLSLLKEISGVTEAIQGQSPSAGTPSSLYAQMSANSTIASKDFFEFFFSARKKRDFKNLQVILQSWTEERYVNVSGKDYDNEAYIYDPEKVQNANFDIVISKSNNAPVFRQLIDDYLFQFLMNGLVDLPMFLENTSLPFADKLQQAITERQQAMQGGEEGQPQQPQQGQQMQMFNGQAGRAGGQSQGDALIKQFMGAK